MLSKQEFNLQYQKICKEINLTGMWCFVKYQTISNCTVDLDTIKNGIDYSREILSSISSPAEKAFNEFISDIDKKFNLSCFYELHIDIVIAVSLAIKHYVCPDIFIGVELETSKWTNNPNLWWVLSRLNPEGKLIKSKAAYNAQIALGELPIKCKVRFDYSASDFSNICNIIEHLQVGDALIMKVIENSFQICKDDILLGELMVPDNSIPKKHQKKISTCVECVTPLSKRSKRAKMPELIVRLDYDAGKKESTKKKVTSTIKRD